jgi:hypothetical protein
MRRVTCLTVLALAVAVPAHPQTAASGSVHGTASDEHGGVLPGVSVNASSATVPGVFTASTDVHGQYRLLDLPPGDYAITAALSGFASVRRNVTVRAGLNVDVNFTLTVGAIGETIEVTAETPLLETRNGAQSVNVSGTLLRDIPLTERREWFGALALAPGVTTATFNDSRLLYVRGADSNATVIQVDGADVTAAARAGVSYLSLNMDTVDDIQIQTSAIDASAPLGIGGVINIASTSGTNQFKGAAGLFFQPRVWNGSNNPGGTSSTTDQTQIDLSYGGPVTKDRLWAFGSFRRTDITTGVSRSATQLEVFRALLSDYEPADTVNKASVWFTKITAQPSKAHQLIGFYQKDVSPMFTSLANVAKAYEQASGGSAALVRLSSMWSNHLTSRVAVAYNNKRRETRDTGVDGPMVRVYDSTLLSSGRLTGNGLLAYVGSPVATTLRQPNEKLTVSADATLFARHRSGSHELQAGVFFQPKVQGNHLGYINDGFNLEDRVFRQAGVYAGGTVVFHRQIIGGVELTSFEHRAKDYAAYIQDGWRPTSRLTISAGVRVDHIVNHDRVVGVVSQRSTDIGPRFGVNYAITRSADSVARAHWVRVHDQPGMLSSVGSPSLGQRDVYDLNVDGVFETEFVTPPTVGVLANRLIDADLHQPSVREWGVGFSKQLHGGITANIDAVHRRFDDRPTLLEVNGKYDGSVFAGYLDEAFNEIYSTTNNRWNTPVYQSLELSITKRTKRVQALASYVRQWRHIDGTWQPNDPASFIQPDAFANDRGIGSSTGATTAATDANSLSGTHMTQIATGSAQWQDHAVRAGVTFQAPWRLLIASNYTFQSGVWSGPVVTRLAAADPKFGPSTVRLSNGRTVSNPLATVIRFAYPTRGDGQLRTEPLHAWNLRLGRRFPVGRVRLDASLDLFNVTNTGADLGFESGANQTYNVVFGRTKDRQLPRSAQVVVRASF